MGNEATGLQASALVLKEALERDTLRLDYQAIAEIATGRMVGVEALPVWPDGYQDASVDGGLERCCDNAGLGGLYVRWLLARVRRDARRWQADGAARVTVYLAVTPAQLCGAEFAAARDDALAWHDLPPGALTLQLRGAAPDCSLAGWLALGQGVALDHDHPAALSPALLKASGAGQLRLDCSPLGERHSGETAQVLGAAIAMAHALGVRVVARNVEAQHQYDFLALHLCDAIQGGFAAAPGEAAGVASLLKQPVLLRGGLRLNGVPQRSLLLVDDEKNILASLRRLLRADGYQIHCAESGEQGLAVLAEHAVDVIVSDQRMPGMLGSDFLRKAKQLRPDTIRIMLSGYTELQSVTDAVNEGAIYKFLTKPWDDELLRGHLAEAFRLKEVADENQRLQFELLAANRDLAAANVRMEVLLQEKQRQITLDEVSLGITRDVLEHLTVAVMGLDDLGVIAFVNASARRLLQHRRAVLGATAASAFPELFPQDPPGAWRPLQLDGQLYAVASHAMGSGSASRGTLLIFTPEQAGA